MGEIWQNAYFNDDGKFIQIIKIIIILYENTHVIYKDEYQKIK